MFARYGVRWAKESAAGRMGTGMLLGMLGFALLWAVQVPFSVLELWWERRHHLSSLGYCQRGPRQLACARRRSSCSSASRSRS